MKTETAYMLIEFQEDYFPGGRAPIPNSLEASKEAHAGLCSARERSLHVIHIQQISTHPNAKHCLPCTKGSHLYSTLQPIQGETIIKKHYPNAFKDTHLLNYLKKHRIKHLVICGMMTHLSIDSTVRAARDFGFSCTVLSDACAAKDLTFHHHVIPAHEVHQAFLAALYPTYAKVSSTQEYLNRAQQPLQLVG